MSKGYVYILTNPSMPGLVKIGKTTRDVEQRANELYQKGVPEPFGVSHHVYSPDCNELEIMVHRLLAASRVSTGREFFRDVNGAAFQALEDALREQVEDWLAEFIPDHTIVNDDEFVDTGAFYNRSFLTALIDCGSVYPDLPNILYELEGGDIVPAIGRWKKRIDDRKEKMESSRAALKIVGEE